MTKFTIELTAKANQEISTYIESIRVDDPAAAQKMYDRIEKRIRLLMDMPYLGTECDDVQYAFLRPGYRRLVINPIVIYYLVDGLVVTITRAIHERRDVQNAWDGDMQS